MEQDLERRRRVLIENPHADAALAQATALEKAGFEASVCMGPEHQTSRCWLLESGSCPLADDADVIVFDLDLEDPTDRAVLRALARRYPGKPVVAEVSEEESRHHGAELASCTVVVPYSMDHLTGAVLEALNPA